MPMKRSAITRLEKWSRKVFNPYVAVVWMRDSKSDGIDRMGRYVEMACIIEEVVCDILDKRGIAGMVRLDYHGFARRIWRLFYKEKEELALKLVKPLCEHYEVDRKLNGDVLREIVEKVRDLVYRFKFDEKMLSAEGEVIDRGGQEA